MATQESKNETPEHLKYQTCVLKVSIHCEGCKKKVHKLLHNIDGVFTVSIDSQQHKVSVTGNVEAEKLIRNWQKQGNMLSFYKKKRKKAEAKIRPENPKKKKKKEKIEEKHDQINLLGSSDENGEEDEKTNSTESGGKKKKKKGKKGNNAKSANAKDALAISESFPTGVETIDPPIGMMHLGPPYGHVYSYYPHQTFGMSYSTSYPSGTSSYCDSPAFAYNHRYAGYRQPPPPSAQIRGYNNYEHDGIYVENDGEGGCSIM